MGTLFKYISDKALKTLVLDYECQHCGKTDIPTYDFNGDIVDPTLASDVELAKSEPEIYYACEDCIKSGNIKTSSFQLDNIKKGLSLDLQNVVSSKEFKLQPYVMFMQHADWPFCCNDMTEYIGEEPDSDDDFATYECWKPMSPSVSNFELKDFYPLDKIEPLNTMCLFQCKKCLKKYWNFQYSGLFWPGPIERTDDKEKTKPNEKSSANVFQRIKNFFAF